MDVAVFPDLWHFSERKFSITMNQGLYILPLDFYKRLKQYKKAPSFPPAKMNYQFTPPLMFICSYYHAINMPSSKYHSFCIV